MDKLDGRPRLLAVSAVPPWPPNNGLSLRCSHFLSELAKRWHVTVASPVDPTDGEVPTSDIEWIRFPDIPATDALPWMAERSKLSEGLTSLLSQRSFDAGLVWCGAEFVAEEVSGFPPAVADRVDCGTLQAWRNVSRAPGLWERLRTLRRVEEQFRFERKAFRPYAAVVVTGSDDARALRRISRHRRILVIPNGVHTRRNFEADEAEVPTVIFTGVLAYPPNIEAARFFAEDVWPLVRGRVSGARFVIAGRVPTPTVLGLQRIPGVELHVDVPDMTEELRKSWLAVAPMRSGSGIKNKVLEAWAAWRPTVLTPLATNGLRLDASARSLVATTAKEIADRVVMILSDAAARKSLGQAARELVEREHSWTAVAGQLDEELLAMLSREPTPDRAS